MHGLVPCRWLAVTRAGLSSLSTLALLGAPTLHTSAFVPVIFFILPRMNTDMLVSVGDREADIYELFHAALNDPQGPKLLVRASHNRLLADEQSKLLEYVAGQALSGKQVVRVCHEKSVAY